MSVINKKEYRKFVHAVTSCILQFSGPACFTANAHEINFWPTFLCYNFFFRTKIFAMSETSEAELRFVHSVSGSGRVLPSASRWNSIELDFSLLPQQSDASDSLPSRFSKSVDFNLTISDKNAFKRCLYVSILVVISVPVLVLLLHFLIHKKHTDGATKNLTLALNQALLFFDAQKCTNSSFSRLVL